MVQLLAFVRDQQDKTIWLENPCGKGQEEKGKNLGGVKEIGEERLQNVILDRNPLLFKKIELIFKKTC